MKIIIITFLFILSTNIVVNIPEKMEKRIDKEILALFDSDSYKKELIIIDEELNKVLPLKFGEDNFYKISINDLLTGYFYYGKAPSKADVFDYVVIFDKEMVIRKIKILAYREDYGGEIGSKRWLKQFNNLSQRDQVVYSKDIMGISGATISARSMTITVNNLLKSLSIIQSQDAL